MGTRADFWLYDTFELIWLGSIGMDGDPASVIGELSLSFGQSIASEDDWRESVTTVLENHDEATHPDWGWPWPWPTSSGTDYAYCWDANVGVWVTCFDSGFLTLEKVMEDEQWPEDGSAVGWPDMSSVQEIRWDTGNAPMLLDGLGHVVNPPREVRNRPKERP